MMLRESDLKETTTTFCVPCFEKCKSCYFGKNNVNLNAAPWDDYNN